MFNKILLLFIFVFIMVIGGINMVNAKDNIWDKTFKKVKKLM